uniref:Protein UXT n=2 Tax=Lygus hesperus TaxID=30085 RepID=A0A0A9WPS5_LYGHE
MAALSGDKISHIANNDVVKATGSSHSSSNSNKEKSVMNGRHNRILVDLGSHFYTPAKVYNATRVHVNLGCGVLLEMSTEEAEAFLIKKEAILRGIASRKTREVLQMKYRIRLVTEIIARLHERDIGHVK